MFKVYRINTRTGSVLCEQLKEEYKTYGNRGLVAKVMTDEVNPQCDPMGLENKLVICTGILAGTALTTANRLSVGAKSPLTGGIKEANVGGNVGFLLAGHGIKMIIVEDVPSDDKWRLIKVNADGQVELVPADDYVGLNNYALVKKLHERYGEDIGVLSIGTAGERGYRIASLQATDYSTKTPTRAAARGGLGAVAGSKKIKALVVQKPKVRARFPYVDKGKFDQANKKYVEALKAPDSGAKGLHLGGTVPLLDLTAQLGILPVRNFSGRFFAADKLEKINSKKWLERVTANGKKKGRPCQPGCLIQCAHVYCNDKGEVITSGLEYETYALCGPNCDIDNMDLIAEIDRACDDLGVDTMEVGCSLAVIMEAGKIPWGDEEAVREVLRQMVEGKTELGRLLGEGTARLGQALGVKRTPAVKGQAMAGYDPKNLKGIGVTYATSPMGADHTAGNTLGPGDHKNKAGQVARSREAQILMAACDNLMCVFGFTSAKDPGVFAEMIGGALGGDWNKETLLELGKKTLKMERAWNRAAGFTEKHDRLPQYFYEEDYDIMPEEMQEVFTF
ncbi:Aldehyde ferredoxin oxidoreductase, C-terminal [Moorella glycerini]|uniref:Oxidoreductase YdhV n=1 Tax=Neomoorella stamsii TaxID=1266720 RepID=A0A9X7IZT1_9FIRM|nr:MULTISPECIES: aldehyde ferredoxin oxidoreductase C-terminal domain-containing protein [Moorella]PRR68558.1 putative oxidoreductase YdhV [Moorella stamsii]CEP66118.1 Aldehyde ferredoxin oxidoreductase, C-terminal [Moorella glycerini]